MGATVSDGEFQGNGNSLQELGQALQQRGDLTSKQIEGILYRLAQLVRRGDQVDIATPLAGMSNQATDSLFQGETLIPASPEGRSIELPFSV